MPSWHVSFFEASDRATPESRVGLSIAPKCDSKKTRRSENDDDTRWIS